MTTMDTLFKVTIVQEDSLAGVRAAGVLDRLTDLLRHRLGASFGAWRVCKNFWQFDCLNNQEMRKQAVVEAMEADMILISSDGGAELPISVRNWLESVLAQKPSGSALVSVVNRDAESIPDNSAAGPYLRQLAERQGLDFFTNLDKFDTAGNSVKSPGFAPSEAISPISLFKPTVNEWSGWGIND